MIKIYQAHIDETKNLINDLNTQYIQTKETVRKLEPIKNKYNKQVKMETNRAEFKTAVLNITGMLILPLSIFALMLWGIVNQHKKYSRLLKEGKITQEEYDRIMKKHSSTTSSNDMRINPATGLPMTGIGISDVGGNVRGSSSSSSFDHSQDYSNRHRWD